MPNGDVEVRAEADGAVLESFREELERGPTSSPVREVIEEAVRPEPYSSFEIRG